MAIHDGHRQRLKERFAREGLDNFDELQVLELLLFYAIPRQDTNPLAHRLLERYGNLAQVLEAPVEDLAKVPGIGPGAATFLHLVRDAGRYYQVSRTKHEKVLNSIEKCIRFLQAFFVGRRNETVFLLCMDAKCKVLCCKEIAEGSVNSASISTRRIVEIAMGVNASSVILAHNHPSGLAVPSGEDLRTTHRIAAALQTVEIILADHVVLADEDAVSMVQSGYYDPAQYM